MSDWRFFLQTLCGAAAFVGTCSLIAALTETRPLPTEALVAAFCATFIVLVIVAALLGGTRR